jgi:hypothetical protein
MPQLIARIHTREPEIKRLLHNLLAAVGQRHPQALVYPLTVASKSAAVPRRDAAIDLMHVLRQRHSVLIDQAELVSQELIRYGMCGCCCCCCCYCAVVCGCGCCRCFSCVHVSLYVGWDNERAVRLRASYSADWLMTAPLRTHPTRSFLAPHILQRRHPLARGVARRAGRGFPSLLRRGQHPGHDCGAVAAARGAPRSMAR